MSKRNIVRYTMALMRAGVIEEPKWMAALRRCAAARCVPAASCLASCLLALRRMHSATQDTRSRSAAPAVSPPPHAPPAALCLQHAAAAAAQAWQAAPSHRFSRGRTDCCLLPQAPGGGWRRPAAHRQRCWAAPIALAFLRLPRLPPLACPRQVASQPSPCCVCASSSRRGWSLSTWHRSTHPPHGALRCGSWS